MRTGFDILDTLLNGGLPNGLITIGAIPSLGKTTFALQMTDNMASIEYTSDVLIGLEYINNGANEREYEAKRNPRKIVLSVIKNRYGALGKVNYDFYTPYHTFIEK